MLWSLYVFGCVIDWLGVQGVTPPLLNDCDQ